MNGICRCQEGHTRSDCAHPPLSYYIRDLAPDTSPIVLVRESQVQALLNDINTHFGFDLVITGQQREHGFVVQFPDHPRCLPRYLGRSQSREAYKSMADQVHKHSSCAVGEASYSELPTDIHNMFVELIKQLRAAQKGNSPMLSAKKQQDRLKQQKAIADHFKRAQRYLGLRPSLQQEQAPIAPSAVMASAEAAPFPFDQSVVFVCVDVEAYERAQHKITEIGIATLDTRELIGLTPGADGVEWSKKIRARHFRISEYRHLVNRDFVHGCPEKFRFGKSTFVSLQEAAQHIADCFHAPFGAHDSNGAGTAYTLAADQHGAEERRNVVILGHATAGDIRYLQKLGFDPTKVENIIEALDTAVMYRAWRREQQSTGLTRILRSFGIDSFYAHNAGNDAVFTVQAMLAICVREATLRGSPQLRDQRNEEAVARLTAAAEDAISSLKMQEDNWSQLENDGDGGCPIPLTASEPSRPAQVQQPSQAVPQHNDFKMKRGRGQSRGQYRGQSRGQSRGQGRGRGRGRGEPVGGGGAPRRGDQSKSSNRSRGGQRRGQADGAG